jgi:hypothetical protein
MKKGQVRIVVKFDDNQGALLEEEVKPNERLVSPIWGKKFFE